MKAERYLMDYMEKHNITREQVKKDVGISLEPIFLNEKELMADEFLQLCIYLNIEPEIIGETLF